MEAASVLFRIYNDGKEYRIYTNGRVEGFEGTVNVVNYFPRLCFDLLQEEERLRLHGQNTVLPRTPLLDREQVSPLLG